MRKIVFILSLFFFTQLACWAQHVPSVSIGLSSDLNIKRVTSRLGISPNILLQKSRNAIAAGPTFFLHEFKAQSNSKFKLSGLQVTYRYFLSANQDKKFLLFAEYQTKFQRFKEEWQSNYWNNEEQQYIDYQSGNRENIWGNNIGIGFQWSLSQQLAVQSSLGIGYYISRVKSFNSIILDPADNTDYRGYDNSGIEYNAQLGISYKIKK